MASRVNMGSMSHRTCPPEYVKVWENTNSSDPVEAPLEKDGTLLISTLSGQFPNTVGLRFWSDTGVWRGLRCEDSIVHPPAQGWGDRDYYIVYGPPCPKPPPVNTPQSSATECAPLHRDVPLPRGMESVVDHGHSFNRSIRDEIVERPIHFSVVKETPPVQKAPKERRSMKRPSSGNLEADTTEFVLTDLPPMMNEKDIRAHFQEFGELKRVDDIRQKRMGRQRHYAFIQFKTVEGEKAAQDGIHIFNHRRYYLQPSHKSRSGGKSKKEQELPTKLFIGRLPSSVTEADLCKYFSNYGVVKDIHIPAPFKGFGFISFERKDIANQVLNETHVVNGAFLNVGLPFRDGPREDSAYSAYSEGMHQQQQQYDPHLYIGQPGLLGAAPPEQTGFNLGSLPKFQGELVFDGNNFQWSSGDRNRIKKGFNRKEQGHKYSS